MPLPDVEGQLDAKAVDEFADRLEKCRALAIGPGLGRGPRAVAVVRRALDVELPLVIDGDGLWALAEVDEGRTGRPPRARARRPSSRRTPASSRSSPDERRRRPHRRRPRACATTWGAVVHLKGRRAITASPTATCGSTRRATPVRRPAGSGDVLTGIVGSLLAQGMMPEAATWAGAFLHGAGRRPRRRRDSASARSPPATSPDAVAAARCASSSAPCTTPRASGR